MTLCMQQGTLVSGVLGVVYVCYPHMHGDKLVDQERTEFVQRIDNGGKSSALIAIKLDIIDKDVVMHQLDNSLWFKVN